MFVGVNEIIGWHIKSKYFWLFISKSENCYSLTQVALVVLQVPSLRHSMVSLPSSSYPSAHDKLAMLPKTLEATVILPWCKGSGSSQDTTRNTKNRHECLQYSWLNLLAVLNSFICPSNPSLADNLKFVRNK